MECPFLGIDLTSSQSKPSACVGLDKGLNFIFAGSLGSRSEIAAVTKVHQPYVVAIDAPLTLPQGLCCLEESCGCQPLKVERGRSCERELVKLGIPCFFTTKRSIIKQMVYRGIKLRVELESQGYKVIEVYPYASKVCLWGKPIPSKWRLIGLAFLRNHLAALIPHLAPYVEKFDHNLCDAAIAAYTAYLYYLGKTELIGNPEEGMIYIPGGAHKLDTLPFGR
jgi:predicted nuclease with RNAse H fold